MRTCVLILGLLTVLSPTQAQEPIPSASRAIVALDAEEPELSEQKAHGGLLIREIVRQAILIAGRDGLGLSTRDRVLGEAFPEGAKVLTARTLAIPGTSVRVRIGLKGDAPDAKPLGEHTIPLPPGDAMDYAALVREAEALSRGGFIETLKAAGLKGTPNVKADRGPVSDALERRLMTLTFTEQFAALRELHAAARAHGEAPVRLAAIVRGYAHLGKMTEGLLNASHKAFKARALLYAERAGALWPGTPYSLWIRAYARAFAGLPGTALEDIEAAAKIPADPGPPGSLTPIWVPWIEAYCRYNTPALAAAEAPYNRGLLRFIGYLTYEACKNDAFERRQALRALQANPECYRLFEALCEIGGISNLHEATVEGPRTLAESLYTRLSNLPSFPDPIRKIIGEMDNGLPEIQARPRVWKELLATPDATEPSWGTLGRLIQETTFVQTWRRGDFMRYKWSVEVGSFLAEIRPLIKDHPYAALIESYGLDRQRQSREWEALFSGLNLVDVETSARPLVDATWSLEPKDRILGRKAWALARLHQDAVAWDLERAILLTDIKDMEARKRGARALLLVNPHSPLAIRELIISDWSQTKSKAAEWEKTLGHHPQILHALGAKYLDDKRNDDAERCLVKVVDMAPSKPACWGLAEVYRRRNDMDRWKAVLDAYLQTDDVGLDHANVQVAMAREYMSRKEWSKAQPYAEAAAQTWASWAMGCARDCYEGMGNLEKAHLWQKRISERYPEDAADWYLWVKRTGYGEEREAEARAIAAITARPGQAGAEDYIQDGIIHQLAGRPRDALKAFQEAVRLQGSPYQALHAALMALELQDEGAREQAIKAGIGFDPKTSKNPARESDLIRSIAEIITAGTDAKIDLKGWEGMVGRQDSIGKTNLPYFMGRFLELRGRKDDAKAFYRLSVEAGQTRRWNAVLSANALRRLE